MRARAAVHRLAALAWCLVGCGGASGEGDAARDGLAAVRAADGTIVDDRPLCKGRDREDREVSETAGPGAIQPNVRRVWQVFGSGANQRKVLVCREIDSNLDGVKDVVRTYDEEGQSKEERADTNYDGQIDTWIVFGNGRIAEIRLDRNFDGEPDEWKNFVEGKLIRVKRDSNHDQKPDVWEIYHEGRLVRMGVDLDHDTRIDRWDHDAEWRRRRAAEEEAKERKNAEGDEAAEEDGTEGDGDDDGRAPGGTAPNGEGAAPPAGASRQGDEESAYDDE